MQDMKMTDDIICPGSLVRALAGRDKGSLFVATELHDGFASIADGKSRKLGKPKRKNVKHISPTGIVIGQSVLSGLSDRGLYRLIAGYAEGFPKTGDNDIQPYLKRG